MFLRVRDNLSVIAQIDAVLGVDEVGVWVDGNGMLFGTCHMTFDIHIHRYIIFSRNIFVELTKTIYHCLHDSLLLMMSDIHLAVLLCIFVALQFALSNSPIDF